MGISERNIFICENDMRLDEDIIARTASFEIMVAFERFLILKYRFYLVYFLSCEGTIEEHRYAAPDDREGIADDPEGDKTCEYRIDPPDPKEFREDESDEDTRVHHEIRGVVECIRPDEE
jgi:hypothetical protein